jgi:hypothetical protein
MTDKVALLRLVYLGAPATEFALLILVPVFLHNRVARRRIQWQRLHALIKERLNHF